MNPYFPVAILHRVTHLDEAVQFFVHGLDFALQSSGAQGVVLNNGALAIRLQADEPSSAAQAGRSRLLSLEVVTRDLPRASTRLSELGARPLGEVIWVTAQRQEQRFEAPHGLEILLCREYNEDEVGLVPDLPMSLEWEVDAIARMKELLRRVPVDFRDQARRRATERAEHLALREGDVSVDVHCAIRGLVQMTPAIRIRETRAALIELGFDPERWSEDFER